MTTKMEPITILLVEDDLADQKLIKLSLKNQMIANDIKVANSGEEALDYLHNLKPDDSDNPRPDLILLDLNMPGMGGKEFLRQIKLEEKLRIIPVIILTTSESERDIFESYQLQASGYIHKPVTLEEFKTIMEKIKSYWFMVCKLPNKER